MIRTRCVYDAPSRDAGLRVLVTRYWPRGVKKGSVDVWLKDLGTEPSLIKSWKAGKITLERFRQGYREGLEKEAARKALGELKERLKGSKGKGLTLLCICRDEEMCHRLILKEILDKG